MDYSDNDNALNETEGKQGVSGLNLITPASSRAGSPVDHEFVDQDPFIEPRNLQNYECLTSIEDNVLVNSIIPISRIGNDMKIICKIGEGAFGVVMKVHHQIDKQFYALKCIPFINEDRENRIKIMQEANTLAELKHENLVQYGDSWIDNYLDGNGNTSCNSSRTLHLCILTELCDTNLTHLINDDLYKQPSRARSIFWKIAEGLGYLHSKGFIHGDLRADNILIKKMDLLNKKSECGICSQMCYSSSRLPCKHICCPLCVKVISIETKECAICHFKIPFGYFNRTEKQIIQWEYQGTKRWWQYDEQSNIALENAFNSGNLECALIVKSTMYRINFQDMVQMQASDRAKRRKIRREPPYLTTEDDDVDDVKIGDFGLTKLASARGLSTKKDDIYRLGVILLDIFLYSLISKTQCIGWTQRQKLETALRNKEPENFGLIYVLKELLNEDFNALPSCAKLLGPIRRGYELMSRRKKRQAEQSQEDNTKRMRETKLQ